MTLEWEEVQLRARIRIADLHGLIKEADKASTVSTELYVVRSGRWQAKHFLAGRRVRDLDETPPIDAGHRALNRDNPSPIGAEPAAHRHCARVFDRKDFLASRHVPALKFSTPNHEQVLAVWTELLN